MQRMGYDFTMNNYYMFTPNGRYDNVLFLYQAGYEKCNAHSRWSGKRDFYLIHYIIDGKGEYRVGDKVYPLHKDDAFVIFPGEEIDYRADAEHPYEYCWLGFNGVSAREVVETCGFAKKQTYVLHVDNALNIADKMLSVCREQEPDIKQFLHTYAVFYDILGILAQQGKYFDRREFVKDYALLATEYIEANYGNFDLSVDTLAKYLTLSRSQVYRIFKKSFDVSPQEYIANFRLDKGCNLVKRPTCRWRKLPICAVTDLRRLLSNDTSASTSVPLPKGARWSKKWSNAYETERRKTNEKIVDGIADVDGDA